MCRCPNHVAVKTTALQGLANSLGRRLCACFPPQQGDGTPRREELEYLAQRKPHRGEARGSRLGAADSGRPAGAPKHAAGDAGVQRTGGHSGAAAVAA